MGVSCGEYRRHGAFAEYVSVPERILARLPDELSFERAAMVEPVSVALHGVHRAGVQPGQRVVVVGAGMIGLLVVQVLKAKGAGEIIAVDLDDSKLQMALQLGADSISKNSAGMELDAAIEAVGITPTVAMAIQSVRKGGAVALVGNLCPKVEIPLQVLVTREISVFGCCASQGDYDESLALIADGRVKVDGMISAKIGLEQTAEYFDRLHRQEAGLMKVLVCP